MFHGSPPRVVRRRGSAPADRLASVTFRPAWREKLTRPHVASKETRAGDGRPRRESRRGWPRHGAPQPAGALLACSGAGRAARAMRSTSAAIAVPAAGAAPRPDVAVAADRDAPALLHPGPRARRRRQGGRPLGPEARRREAAPDPARHADGPRLRRAHVPHPAAGQDQLLHEGAGRGGGGGRRRACARRARTCASRPIASRAC